MSNYQTKYLRIKKFGWKRVVKNVEKFGWTLDEAEKETVISRSTSYDGNVYGDKIYIKENVKETKKVFMNLSFHRYKDEFENLSSIFALELLYNIIFLLRRLCGFFLPVLSIVVFVLFALSSGEGTLAKEMKLDIILAVDAIGWILGLVLEGVLASISKKILKIN